MNDKNNELLPDILRGFAIFLMVFGHCIQAGSGAVIRDNALYFQDKLYQFIYSFHMPLFMLIAGYFARQSIDRAENKEQRLKLLKRRSVSLLAPVFFWTFFEFVYTYVSNMLHGYPNRPMSVLVPEYFKTVLVNYWFLWAAFWCFLLVYIMHYYLRDSIILYSLGLLSFFVLPDGMNLGVYKFMVPYYLAAFYLANYIKKKDNPIVNRVSSLQGLFIYTMFCGILFVVLFLFYNEQCFIYTTGFHFIGKNIPRQIIIDIYRILIGFVGSAFFILFWRLQQHIFSGCQFRVFSLMGRNSMGIYLTSGYVLLYGLVKITDGIESSYLINLGTTVIILIVSTLLTMMFRRIWWLSWIVGKPYKKCFDNKSSKSISA